VAFMSSISGRFLYQFGITAAVAVLVSLLVSFTLTPMMSARLLRVAGSSRRKKALTETAEKERKGNEAEEKKTTGSNIPLAPFPSFPSAADAPRSRSGF